ncbi:MAG: hypothetical protein ACR2Q4_22445, partial [Geminicoccaceae bacterium]
ARTTDMQLLARVSLGENPGNQTNPSARDMLAFLKPLRATSSSKALVNQLRLRRKLNAVVAPLE